MIKIKTKKNKKINNLSKKKRKLVKQKGGTTQYNLPSIKSIDIAEIIEEGHDPEKEIDCGTNIMTSFADSLHDFKGAHLQNNKSIFKEAFSDYIVDSSIDDFFKQFNEDYFFNAFIDPVNSHKIKNGSIIPFIKSNINSMKFDDLVSNYVEIAESYVYDAGDGQNVLNDIIKYKCSVDTFCGKNENLATIIDPSGSNHIVTDKLNYETEFLYVYDKYFYFLKNINNSGITDEKNDKTKSIYIFFKYRTVNSVDEEICTSKIQKCTKAWCILYMTGNYSDNQTKRDKITSFIKDLDLTNEESNKKIYFNITTSHKDDKVYAIKINTTLGESSFTINNLNTTLNNIDNIDTWGPTIDQTPPLTDLKIMSYYIYDFLRDGISITDEINDKIKNKIKKYLFTNKIIGDRGQGDITYLINKTKNNKTNWIDKYSELNNIFNKKTFVVTGDRMLFVYLVTMGIPALMTLVRGNWLFLTESKTKPYINVQISANNSLIINDLNLIDKYISNKNCIEKKNYNNIHDILFSVPSNNSPLYNWSGTAIEAIPINKFNKYIQNTILESIYKYICEYIISKIDIDYNLGIEYQDPNKTTDKESEKIQLNKEKETFNFWKDFILFWNLNGDERTPSYLKYGIYRNMINSPNSTKTLDKFYNYIFIFGGFQQSKISKIPIIMKNWTENEAKIPALPKSIQNKDEVETYITYLVKNGHITQIEKKYIDIFVEDKKMFSRNDKNNKIYKFWYWYYEEGQLATNNMYNIIDTILQLILNINNFKRRKPFIPPVNLFTHDLNNINTIDTICNNIIKKVSNDIQDIISKYLEYDFDRSYNNIFQKQYLTMTYTESVSRTSTSNFKSNGWTDWDKLSNKDTMQPRELPKSYIKSSFIRDREKVLQSPRLGMGIRSSKKKYDINKLVSDLNISSNTNEDIKNNSIINKLISSLNIGSEIFLK